MLQTTVQVLAATALAAMLCGCTAKQQWITIEDVRDVAVIVADTECPRLADTLKPGELEQLRFSLALSEAFVQEDPSAAKEILKARLEADPRTERYARRALPNNP